MPWPSAHHYSSLLTPNATITGLLTTLGTSGLAAHIHKIPRRCITLHILTSSPSRTIHFKSAPEPEPECLLVLVARPGRQSCSRTRDWSRSQIILGPRESPLARAKIL